MKTEIAYLRTEAILFANMRFSCCINMHSVQFDSLLFMSN